MAKKKSRGFQWVREDQDEVARERVERPIRQREKEHTRSLEAWVRRLCDVPVQTRRMLPIDPEIISGIERYAGMSRTPARGRLARRLAQQLRFEDLDDRVSKSIS